MVTATTIKKGYNQPELRGIPEDWDVISYGEAFDFLSTASYSRADLSDNDEVFYVHYGDIHTTWNYFLDFKKYTLPTIEKIKVKNYSFIKDGDLIMADASEDYDGIGKSVEVKNITTNKAISGLHTFLLRGKEGIFVDGFKGYIHSNRIVKNSMDRLATGLKVYSVSKTNLKTIQIPRPTLPEQNAIATVLSDTDALIERLEKLIAKKMAIKQGTMQQLLTGKKRLQGFSGEWKVKELGEIETVIDGDRGKNYPSYNDFSNDGYCLFLSAKNVTKNGFKFSECLFIKEEKDSLLSKGKLTKSDIVLTTRGTVGNVALFDDTILFDNIRINSGMVILRNENNLINTNYLYEVLKSQASKNQIDRIVFGSAQPQLTVKGINKFQIPVPPTIKEQTTIATILSDMDAEIERLEQNLDKYTMLKQGMMQQLLTGRIRIHGTN